MTDDEAQDISQILESLKANSKLGETLEQAQIWERWAELAGPELAPHGQPLSVRDGTLTIEVDNAVWMHKLSYIKTDIIEKINAFLTHEKVSEIFMTLKSEDEDPEAKKGS